MKTVSENPDTNMKTIYASPNNLVDMFEQSAARWSDNRLFGVKNPSSGEYEWTTYQQIAERINHLRGAFKRLGLEKGEKVGVILDNCPSWFVCEQATHGLGGVFIPMYEKELKKIWQYIITDASIKFLFVSNEKIYEQVKEFKGQIPSLKDIFVIFGSGDHSLTDLEEMGKGHPAPSIKPAWSDLANIIYTSGTTGDPKGVMLSHLNLTRAAMSGVSAYGLNETMRVVAFLPWAHCFGLSADLHCYISCGGSMGFAPSMAALMKTFQEVKPTGLSAVPKIFTNLYDGVMQSMSANPEKKKFFDAACEEAAKNRGLKEKTEKYKEYDKLVFAPIRALFGGELQFVVGGGAVMKPNIAQFFSDIGMPIYDCYGLTETSPGFTDNCPVWGNRPGSVGRPVAGMKVVIDKSRVGEESKDGEICAYGAHVMMGYYNKPKQTHDIMLPDKWEGFPGIRTGDRGWVDEDGFLFITGRFKDEYKLANGKYIHPEGIETEMKYLKFIANCVLYGDGKDYNVAIIIPDFAYLKTHPKTAAWAQGTPEETAASKEIQDYLSGEIIAHLRNTYGGYEVPQKFLFIAEDFTLDNGMLTQTSKVKRPVVLKKYGEQLTALYNA